MRTAQNLLREPLLRLLAMNLAIGVSAAVLLLCGLLLLNPQGLRDLIVSDRSPLMALSLLLFGFVVTFGSVAMGTAVMALGRTDSGGGVPKPVPLPASAPVTPLLLRDFPEPLAQIFGMHNRGELDGGVDIEE